jgi:KipI family sensor histidine kinase inhibitor
MTTTISTSTCVDGAEITVSPCGDSALRATVSGAGIEGRWRAAQHLADRLMAAQISGLYGVVPTYESVLIEFDCTLTEHSEITRLVRQVADDLRHHDAPIPPSRTFHVPVQYGGEHGPDLRAVAEFLGVTTDTVIELHTAQPLRIRCLGAPAGSPMMDGPAFGRQIPRLQSPRASVPAGAVSVAGAQAVIAPAAAPGGWQVLGATPLQLLDLKRDPFVSYRPGDLIHFHAITGTEWDLLTGSFLDDGHV